MYIIAFEIKANRMKVVPNTLFKKGYLHTVPCCAIVQILVIFLEASQVFEISFSVPFMVNFIIAR